MGQRRRSPRDTVRYRARNRCEKCGVKTVRFRRGLENSSHCRSIHHRKPRRCGGTDSVVNLVNLCLGCHRGIHADEFEAALGGWIVIDREPALAPFEGRRGWVLPDSQGTLTYLDFGLGRIVNLPPVPRRRHRKRVAVRPQFDKKLRRTA